MVDEVLAEHLLEPGDPGGPDGVWDEARREAATRLLDAAIGALAATGQLVSVAEDVLRDQRDRLAADRPPDHRRPPATKAPPAARHRIDLSY